MNKIYIKCPCCSKINVVKNGTNSFGMQQYLCLNDDCICTTFIINNADDDKKSDLIRHNLRTSRRLQYATDKK